MAQDPDAGARASAASALGEIGDVMGIDGLVKALADTADNVRGSAAAALGKLGNKRSVPHIASALCRKEERENVCVSCCLALGTIGDKSASPILIELLRGDSLQVQAYAAEALGRIRDTTAVDALEAVIRDSREFHTNVKVHAILALADRRRESWGLLTECLTNPQLCPAAATALGWMASPKAANYLLPILKVPHSRARAAALIALHHVGFHDANVMLDLLNDSGPTSKRCRSLGLLTKCQWISS